MAGAWQFGILASAPLRLARQAMDRRDAPAAQQWIDLARQFRGDPAELELLQARLERRYGDLPAMERHLERAAAAGAAPQRLERERTLASAQTGQLTHVEEQIVAWLTDPGEDGADICDAYANGLARQGRLRETHLVLDAWQADFPHDPEPHLRRGLIAEHGLDIVKAEQEYRAALEKQAHYTPALFALARLLLDRKRPEEALPLFRQCAAQAPVTAPAAHVGEAGCLSLLGRADEAQRLLEGVLALDDAQRAEAYQRVLYQPEGDPAAFQLGKLEAAAGNHAQAERWLRQALAKNPHDLEARYALAVSLQRQKKSDEAQAEFDYVTQARQELAETDKLHDRLSTDPANVELRYRIGAAYLKYRSDRAGVYWLQSALAYNADYAPAHQALADYYAARARESKAFASLAEYHRDKAAQSPPQKP